MKLFFHFLKYHLLFNKITLLILSGVALTIVGLSTLLMDTPLERGEAIMQYSAYLFFIKLTGKLSNKTGFSFDTKHLVAFPINYFEIVLLKSVTETIENLPVMISFLYGFSLALPNYNLLGGAILLVMALTLGNITALNKKIDFTRMQYAKASMKNSLLYFNKYLQAVIYSTGFVFTAIALYLVFKNKPFLLEYAFFVVLSFCIVIATVFTIKMYHDETLSYFFWKRDGKRILIKLLFPGTAILALLLVKGGHLTDKDGAQLTENNLFDSLKKEIPLAANQDAKDFLFAVSSRDKESLDTFISEKKEIPWDIEVLGNYPPHFTIMVNNEKAFDFLSQQDYDWLEMKTVSTHKTPLHMAAKYCHIWAADKLVKRGANLNARDTEGNTPILLAAKNDCSGVVAYLKFSGADLSFEDKDKKDVFFYTKQVRSIHELLGLELEGKENFRGLASENDSTLEYEKEYQLQERPHQE